MENDVLDGLSDLGYEGPLLDEVAFMKALDGGPKSLEFTKLIHILAEELKTLCHLEETINVMNNPDESVSFLLELSSFLKELGCPYKALVIGHMSSRLQSKEDRLLLLDYMISELMAARMVSTIKPSKKKGSGMEIVMQESPTAKDLKEILISLKFNKPPPNITPEMLFSKLEAKLKDTIQKEGDQLVGKPLYNKSITEKDWKKLETDYTEMFEEYRLRRETLITRLECTIQSFEWSDRLKSKKDDIQSTYRPKREHLKVKPDVKLSDFLAARTTLLQVEKTSSASVRKNTQSDVNKVIIGQVPDRGGRPNEQQPPPPEMPSWQQRTAPQGGRGGGRGGRGGGGFGGGGGRGGPPGGHNGPSGGRGGRVQGGYNQSSGEQARPQTSPAGFNQSSRNYQTYEVPPGGYNQYERKNGHGHSNQSGGYDSMGNYNQYNQGGSGGNSGGYNKGYQTQGYSQGYSQGQSQDYNQGQGYQSQGYYQHDDRDRRGRGGYRGRR
ncbi:protein FAM98A [Achroia grisella]|uniref:protein FAM98A n=1 Tax=Achroia grisella TaxID=688607 RepID=UPI0027D22DDA|nr:protein FAM98A [Achroia grisella]